METLTLPTTYSLGKIVAYLQGKHEHPQLIDARGTIQIPADARVFLDVSQEVCDDLSRIHLVPERLLENGITFSEKNLDKTDFRKLLSLEPRCLVISYCNEISPKQALDLGELRALEHLNVSHTPFQDPEFSWISQLLNLKTLLLSEAGVEDDCLVFITKLQHLEGLHLSNSKISDRGAQAIWRMASLRELSLSACPIADKALEGIGGCSSLCSLMLPDTGISDKGVEIIVTEALRIRQRLTSLSLRSCRITDKALVRLASLKSLELLDLYFTEVTTEGASFLKKSLPECRIFVGRNKGGGPKLWRVDEPRPV